MLKDEFLGLCRLGELKPLTFGLFVFRGYDFDLVSGLEHI